MKVTSALHGTRSRYSAGCRCDECRQANRDYATARRRGWGIKPQPRWAHGTLYGYSQKGCRCGACTLANTEQKRRQRGAKRKPPVVPRVVLVSPVPRRRAPAQPCVCDRWSFLKERASCSRCAA